MIVQKTCANKINGHLAFENVSKFLLNFTVQFTGPVGICAASRMLDEGLVDGRMCAGPVVGGENDHPLLIIVVILVIIVIVFAVVFCHC